MSDENKYTVIDLSDKLQVPRTTVTDWLSRYASFVDFKMQGKRKVYTDKSVEVLLEIKTLRDQGLSSFDIEEELIKRHPIHGEFSSSSEDSVTTSKGGQEESSKKEANADTRIVRQNGNNSEIAEMLKNMLLEMTRRMDDLERQNRINLERTARWNFVSFSTILILSVVSIFGFLLIKNLTEEKAGIDKEKYEYLLLSQNLSNELKEVKNQKRDVESKLLELDGDRKLFEIEIKKMQNEIEKQKEEFEEAFKNKVSDIEQTKEAEIIKQRDKFAEERLAFLQELEKLKGDKQAMTALLEKLQKQSLEQEAVINQLKEPKNLEIPPLPPEIKRQ